MTFSYFSLEKGQKHIFHEKTDHAQSNGIYTLEKCTTVFDDFFYTGVSNLLQYWYKFLLYVEAIKLSFTTD